MPQSPARGTRRAKGRHALITFFVMSTMGTMGAALCLWTAGCTNISTRLAMNKGINFFKAKEYEKAAEAFKEAIKIDPTYADAQLDLGLTYMELYEPGSEFPKDLEYADGAIQAFKKYIELNPSNEKAQEYLINICNLSKRMQDAVDFFKVDYERHANDLKKVRTMAALYRMAGDMDNAIVFSEKVAELEPNNPENWYTVGVYYWGRSYNSMNLEYDTRMKILDKGLAALDKALSLKKDYFEAITYVSLLYRQKAQYDISPAEAVSWRQKADESLAKAMELRNKALAEQAAAAAAASGTPQPAAPAKTGGE